MPKNLLISLGVWCLSSLTFSSFKDCTYKAVQMKLIHNEEWLVEDLKK